MKVNVFKLDTQNNGILIKEDRIIEIRRNRWIDSKLISHPLDYERSEGFSNKNVYYLHLFKDGKKGKFISLNFYENQKFQLIQGSHWIQKEENIRYLVNLFYLTVGLVFAYTGMT